MALISDSVKDSLVMQISKEKYNANLYLSFAAFLKSKGFDNLAKHFEKQHDEEESHALFIYELLTDLNEMFTVLAVPECSFSFSSLSEMGSLYLKQEIETTESLKEIREMAADETNGGCPIVETAMLDMITKQQHELAEANTFNDKCNILGDDWKAILLWDASFK